MPARSPCAPSDLVLVATVLAFIAGFADASTFVGADGVFCSHVTGNIVIGAAHLARGARHDELLRLATLPLFVGVVLGVSFIQRKHDSRRGHIGRPLLQVNAALLAVSALLGLAGARVHGVAFLVRPCVAVLLTAAMASQNAFHRFEPELAQVTTVMTTNLTSFLATWGVPSTPSPAHEESSRKRRMLACVLVGFAGGCVVGAFGVSRFGFVVLVMPMALSLWCASKLYVFDAPSA